MKYSIYKKYKNTNLKAFSLLEVLISIAIFGIIMAISFLKYPRMNAEIDYQKNVSELVSMYRSAQVFGASRGGNARGDGVYIEGQNIKEFTDTIYTALPKENGLNTSNRYYNTLISGGSPADTVFKDTYLGGKITVSNMCVKKTSSKTCNISKLSVVFVRPNQQAHISDIDTNTSPISDFKYEFDVAYIELKTSALDSLNNVNVRCIRIYKLGQITIDQKLCSDNSI